VGYEVPGSCVPVTDEGVGFVTVEGAAVPDRVGWGLEVGGGVMEIAQQTADLPDPFVAPGVGVHEVAGNVGQDLASVTVISVADDAGTAGETGVLQVDEEGVDGRCPWSCRTQHGVAVPHDWGGLAFGSGEWLEGRMRRH
jgi:hypothetical protein